jgi:hypothetical protein
MALGEVLAGERVTVVLGTLEVDEGCVGGMGMAF